MIYPSADTIEDRVGSRYSLVVLAAKRAKQIKEGSPHLIDTLSTNPLTVALEEIAAGKVTIAVPALNDDNIASSNAGDAIGSVSAEVLSDDTASNDLDSESTDASDGLLAE